MRGIRVATVADIPVKVNWTFLVVLPLFAAFIGWDVGRLVEVINRSFGSSLDAAVLTAGALPWLLGSVSAVGLFLGVVLHEFGHSLVARHYGYEIDSITLWLLGGVAGFAEMPENWRHELVIAIAGPVVSVALGVVSYATFIALPAAFAEARFVVGYLAILNVVLAVFNLLPGFPMDGGRILRALLARTRTHARATQLAAEVGKLFAFLLALVGLLSNPFLILLGLFIYVAASGEAQQTALKASFEGVSVADVMTPQSELRTVDERASVAALLVRMFEDRHVGYPVVTDGELVGMVTLSDATDVEEVEQEAMEVRDVMTRDVETIGPEADAMAAFERMQSLDVGRLPVVDDGDLVGLVSRTDLMRAFEIIKSGGTSRVLRRAGDDVDLR